MADIAVKLTDKQVEKTVAFLGKIRAGAKGDEKKLIDQLLEKMSLPLVAQQKAINARKEEIRAADFNGSLAKIVVDTFPFMRKFGLTPALIKYSEAVAKTFATAEEDLVAVYDEIRKSRPKADRHNVSIPFELYEKTLSPCRIRLLRLTEAYLSNNQVPLTASEDAPLASRRRSLAKKCFITGMNQGKSASSWDEIEMIGLAFSDQLTHFKLGSALLKGSPRAIDEASNMDTACRDELDESVWRFVNDNAAELNRPKATHRPKR